MFQKITGTHLYQFSINTDGLYSISVSAVCKKKNYLRVEIDNQALKGITSKNRNEYFNIPSSWNGNELRNTAKMVVFVVKLSKGDHSLNFISKGQSEIIVEPAIVKLSETGLVTIFKDIQSEERDCQPWVTVALVDLPLLNLDISVSCQKKFLDSDDVKLVIDGQIQKNTKVFWHGKNWFWRGYQLKGKTQTNRFSPNLPIGIHYVELWGDRTPTLKSLDILLDGEVKETKRIPTVDNPEWTGNFLDDPEEIILARLIFGEARNQSQEVREWVGWSVINRTKAGSWWPDNIHGVILQDGQYDTFKQTDSNFLKIINPLNYENVGELDKASWFECYKIAKNIISGKINNPTKATHFNSFDKKDEIEWFEKNVVPQGEFIKKFGDIYFYWSPN